jgi:hypothetical protein
MVNVIIVNVIMVNVIMVNVIMVNVIMVNVIIVNVIMVNVIMANVIMVNVIMANAIMVNVIMVNAIMVNVIMMSAIAPFRIHLPANLSSIGKPTHLATKIGRLAAQAVTLALAAAHLDNMRGNGSLKISLPKELNH